MHNRLEALYLFGVHSKSIVIDWSIGKEVREAARTTSICPMTFVFRWTHRTANPTSAKNRGGVALTWSKLSAAFAVYGLVINITVRIRIYFTND